ncbi:DUF3313 family protein [Vibrio sp. 10N.261.51.F12]|uniref:DUF3313 family protein n=1 Tax=Vibrio sp. 10N.261.51.F12 TaxID=3229679 RepID=UPI003553EAFB
MKTKILMLTIISVLSGCASSLPKEQEMASLHGGYTYKEMDYSKDEKGLFWRSAELGNTQYQNIIVEDVNVNLSNGIKNKIKVVDLDSFEENIKSSLSAKSEKLFPNDKTADHQATVDVNIIEIEDIGEDVKFREIIPIGGVISLAKYAAGTRDRSVRIVVDIDVKDKSDGHLLARRVFVVNNNGVLENEDSMITGKILESDVNKITEQGVSFILHTLYM